MFLQAVFFIQILLIKQSQTFQQQQQNEERLILEVSFAHVQN